MRRGDDDMPIANLSELETLVPELEDIVQKAEDRARQISAMISAGRATNAIRDGKNAQEILESQLGSFAHTVNDHEERLLSAIDAAIAALESIEHQASIAKGEINDALHKADAALAEAAHAAEQTEAQLADHAGNISADVEHRVEDVSKQLKSKADQLQAGIHQISDHFKKEFETLAGSFATLTSDARRQIEIMSQTIDEKTGGVLDSLKKIDEITRPILPMVELLRKL
jgi:uncharacterized phage infection (PIP) family protein YhgE